MKGELRRCADELTRCIEEFKESATQYATPVGGLSGSTVDVYRLRDTSGRPILAEMYASLGQVLAALASLA